MVTAPLVRPGAGGRAQVLPAPTASAAPAANVHSHNVSVPGNGPEREVAGPAVIAPGGLWSGGPLRAAAILSLPMALGGVMFAFIVLQWFVDRRDPKFAEAPARKDDDSVGFE